MGWPELEHFASREFDAIDEHGTRMAGSGAEFFSTDLAKDLDRFHAAMRRHLSSPVCVRIHRNGGYAVQGHSRNSKHYSGIAVDLHVELRETGEIVSVLDQYLVAERLGCFGGIGVYPSKARTPEGWNQWGMHLDHGRPGRRWLGAKIRPLNRDTLKLCF